jgi:aerobic carbon-monoxide dehydrogenase small subunit
MKLTVNLNGKPTTAEIEPETLLSDFLRETIGLTGTHVGCDTSQCGACVVHIDGQSVKSCTALALSVEGRDVTTIEGVAVNGKMHAMQQAFHENHGLQCGFCTPGMIMSALDLVSRNPQPSETDVRHWLEGNICRCTGYQNIVVSVIAGAKAIESMGAR